MNRQDAMNVVAGARGNAAVVMGPGANCGLMYEAADAPATIYNMDMGYATPVALGVALARPDLPVLAIEGDGSFYAGSTVLSTIWRLKPANLVVVILDNGVWGTGDGLEPTATSCGTDLARLALAAGWDEAHVAQPVRGRTSWPTGSHRRWRGTARISSSARPTPAPTPSSAPPTAPPRRHLLECAVLMRAVRESNPSPREVGRGKGPIAKRWEG